MGRIKSIEEILHLTPSPAVVGGNPNQRGCGRQKIGVDEAGRREIQPAQIHGQCGCSELEPRLAAESIKQHDQKGCRSIRRPT